MSRVSRNDAGKLIGYQRPEVKRHIQDIVTYLNSDDIIFPNSLILALPSEVRFVKSRGPSVDGDIVIPGTLEIPVSTSSESKPAWIVDGQQRAFALSQSKRRDMDIPVNGFVADNVDLQRDQFLRINNSKPLPRGLIAELLPEVHTPLPVRLAAKKIPSALCNLLNEYKNSPFYGLIRRASMNRSKRTAVITDTSIINMIQESLTSPSGCLYPYRNIATGETDFDGIVAILVTYWSAVKNVFPEAWGKKPSASRLMHGVGIRAMGRLMDRIMSTFVVRYDDMEKSIRPVEKEVRKIAPLCRWTQGEWEELNNLQWNELQNVPRHINYLSSFLIRSYMHKKA